ncbi:hypothetical protein OLK001_26050 [Synechocystis sp. LKSZ1]
MQYKIRFRPAFSLLYITLKPKEQLYVSLDTLVSLDEGLTLKMRLGLGWLASLLFRGLGGKIPVLNLVQNPTTEPLTFTLSQGALGDLIPLDITKAGLCIQPAFHIAHTTGVRMGLQWAGFSSWLAGQGLFALKLSGKGRVFVASCGYLSSYPVHQRLAVEHHHLVAYSPKLKLRVNFPKGVVGSEVSGEGMISQLIGGGAVYLQSRSLSGLSRYLRLKCR